MAQIELVIGVRWRWWVRPAMAALTLAAWCGLRFDPEAAARWLSKGAVPYTKRT